MRRNSWKGTHNIHFYATKQYILMDKNEALEKGRDCLSRFLVDNTPGELEMLRVWMDNFSAQLQVGWALE